MAKNTLLDLNNHLFAQLERLGDEDLTSEDIKKEMNRAKALNGVAKNIIDNAKLSLDAAEFAYKKLSGDRKMPDQFLLKDKDS